MKHAFLVIAHNEPQVLMALLRQLDATDFDVYLHIDAKAPDMQRQFAAYAPHHGGYYLLPQHLDVRWGDIAQVEVEMLLFKEAAQHGPYAYYHLLSGVDLLLKTPQQLRQIFSQHPHKEYVSYWHTPNHQRDLHRKVSRYYLFTQHLKDKGTLIHALTSPLRNGFLLLQKLTAYKRSTPPGITFAKGSNWVSITHAFCQYLLQHEPQFHPRLAHTLCPDEIFVQTLLTSSPFSDNVFDALSSDTETSSLRKIDWQRGSPYEWTSADLPELLHSPSVFARKFSSKHMQVVDAIVRHTCSQ